jgi:hypothetical protein
MKACEFDTLRGDEYFYLYVSLDVSKHAVCVLCCRSYHFNKDRIMKTIMKVCFAEFENPAGPNKPASSRLWNWGIEQASGEARTNTT